MTDRFKNILIGLFVTGAIAVGISMILFLQPEVGDGKKTLHVRFSNIAGINIGTRVTFAGKPVGEVISILEIHNAREQPLGPNGQVYFYQLKLKVDSTLEVYNTDDIAMRTTGLMGEKSIAILPKAPLQGKTASLITDQIIYASSVDPLENTFNQISRVANQIQEVTLHLDKWFIENNQPLASAIQSFSTTFGSINEQNVVPTLRSSMDLLSDNLKLIRYSLNEDQLLQKTASLVENLDQSALSFNTDGAAMLKNLAQISDDISRGQGTLGKFLNSEDFYLRMTSITSKAETLMNDINHYGVLFQYDKSWQRSRTKRANLLQALDTPQEFKTYFEGEVDTIQTSLGRLTELLERAGGDPERERVLQSEAFKKDFMKFLNQAHSLSESIKLYSQKLVEN
jgi:phospholipid/cholesterol/gamma-HCH transport system substrate-binding protein